MIISRPSCFNAVLGAALLLLASSALAQAAQRYHIRPYTTQTFHFDSGRSHPKAPAAFLSLRLQPVGASSGEHYEHILPEHGGKRHRFKLRVRPLSAIDVELAPRPALTLPLARLLVYWGCGAQAGSGQPKVMRVDSDFDLLARQLAPRPVHRNAARRLAQIPMTERMIADTDVLTPSGLRLQGTHELTIERYRARFELSDKGEFLPAIEISRAVVADDWSVTVGWKRNPRVAAYFATILMEHPSSQEAVIWTSSEIPEAGWMLSQSHPGTAELLDLIARGVLLSPANDNCTVPPAVTRHASSALVFQVHAYAPEEQLQTQITGTGAPASVRIAPRATSTLVFPDWSEARHSRRSAATSASRPADKL